MNDEFFWIAVCDKHLKELYNKERDGYADVSEDKKFTCDVKECDRMATFELYKNVIPRIHEPFYLMQDIEMKIKGISWRLIRKRNILYPLMEQYDVKYL